MARKIKADARQMTMFAEKPVPAMDANQARSDFSGWVRKVIDRAEIPTLTLGNVEFWFDGDSLCYDIPTSLWEKDSLDRDLIAALTR